MAVRGVMRHGWRRCRVWRVAHSRVLVLATEDIGNYYYGPSHPMKPHRIRMAHNLILNYGLYEKLQVYVRRPPCGVLGVCAAPCELTRGVAAPAPGVVRRDDALPHR